MSCENCIRRNGIFIFKKDTMAISVNPPSNPFLLIYYGDIALSFQYIVVYQALLQSNRYIFVKQLVQCDLEIQ